MNPIDILWVIVASALVMSMQIGFCMLESGLVRSKNTINVALKNLLDFCVAGLLFWLFSFGLMFGASGGGWVGVSNFIYNPTADAAAGFTVFLFQLMFCATAATIVSGAVAERMSFVGYLAVTVICSGVLYPIFGHWAWAEGGWLREMGFVDFAGSSVVHGVGGWMALSAAIVIGPRLGRFTSSKPLSSAHSLSIATFGTLVLFVAWLGFNGGSTLALNDSVPRILVNTILAGCTGALVALLLTWKVDRIAALPPTLNGCIAGLVAITANCHAVDPGAAVVIGGIGGVVGFAAGKFLERLKVDDVVGAWSAHAAAGAWGTVAVGIFGSAELLGTGLGQMQQIGVQALGVGASMVWAGGVGFLCFKLLNLAIPMRVDEEGEHVGLNVAEHGASTEIVDLLTDMARHSAEGEFTQRIAVQPFSEVGQIASEYNRVIEKVIAEMDMRDSVAKRLDVERVTAQDLNRKLLSSIEYAQRIQQAILPPKDALDVVSREHFLLYMPRDIVSGDFYWCTEMEDSVFCIVADCTGHGVPGAFMSILGNSLLHQIVREDRITSPGAILRLLHHRIRHALGQDQEGSENLDGMDVAAIRIDRDTITFAGARRPLWFRHNGRVLEIKGDRVSIGGGRHERHDAVFTEHRIERDRAIDLYLFTDGLADQPNHLREPFAARRLRELLLKSSHLPMTGQLEAVRAELERYRGGASQRDDITLIGLRCDHNSN
jgi:Amt family ammonium transporter